MTDESLLPGSGSTSSRASVAEPLCSQCVSGASVSLCVAADYAGDVLTSADPVGGALERYGMVYPGTPESGRLICSYLNGVSCTSATECTAVGR
jgi:hypothetical protein